MPTYMTHTVNGYQFRRAIPAPLRHFLDKRESRYCLGATTRLPAAAHVKKPCVAMKHSMKSVPR